MCNVSDIAARRTGIEPQGSDGLPGARKGEGCRASEARKAVGRESIPGLRPIRMTREAADAVTRWRSRASMREVHQLDGRTRSWRIKAMRDYAQRPSPPLPQDVCGSFGGLARQVITPREHACGWLTWRAPRRRGGLCRPFLLYRAKRDCVGASFAWSGSQSRPGGPPWHHRAPRKRLQQVGGCRRLSSAIPGASRRCPGDDPWAGTRADRGADGRYCPLARVGQADEC